MATKKIATKKTSTAQPARISLLGQILKIAQANKNIHQTIRAALRKHTKLDDGQIAFNVKNLMNGVAGDASVLSNEDLSKVLGHVEGVLNQKAAAQRESVLKDQSTKREQVLEAIKDLIKFNHNTAPTIRAWLRKISVVAASNYNHVITSLGEGNAMMLITTEDLAELQGNLVTLMAKRAKKALATDVKVKPAAKSKITVVVPGEGRKTLGELAGESKPRKVVNIDLGGKTQEEGVATINKAIADRKAAKSQKVAAKGSLGKEKNEAAPGANLDGVRAVAAMHMPKSENKNLHPVVTDPANFTADVREITKAHPSLLYGAAVMRPSLALAQGHALSLLQGLDITVNEFTVSTELDGFQTGLSDMVRKIKDTANSLNLVSSIELGVDRSKGRKTPATLRAFVRRGQVGLMVVMYSGSTIMVHDMGGFPEGLKIVEDFATEFMPREKGFIHHLALIEGKIVSTRCENKDDGLFPDEAYPFIKTETGGANDFVARYLDSKAAMVNFYGEAGTGKSTLMRKTATLALGRTCMLVDDPSFYQNPNAAAALIQHIRQVALEGGRPMLMLEEADEFIKKKDNTFLPQLLSLTSGVLEVDVKIMIATNLTNIDGIMAAMQRSGRTFSNVEFYRQTPEQATACFHAFKRTGECPVFEANVPLSDILSTKVLNIGTNKRRMGFA